MGETILFGGEYPNCDKKSDLIGWLTDVWLWDGGEWRHEADYMDIGSIAQSMQLQSDYDPSLDGIVIYNPENTGDSIVSVLFATKSGDMKSHHTEKVPIIYGGNLLYAPFLGGLLLTGVEAGKAASLSRIGVWRLSANRHWDPTSVGTGPSTRFSSIVVADRRRNVIVLVGGIDAAGRKLRDTWEYDSTGWKKKADDGLPEDFDSAQAAGAYDDCHGTTVLYNGKTGVVLSWNGKIWNMHSNNQFGAPIVRSPLLAYDSHRKEVLMFGGNRLLTPVKETDEIQCDWSNDLWIYSYAN